MGKSKIALVLLLAAALTAIGAEEDSESEAVPVPAFLEWLHKHDVEHVPLSVINTGRARGRLGVFAKEDIPAGSTIFRVPKDIVLSIEHVMASPLGIIANHIALGDIDLMTIYLSFELNNPDSIWRPYLDILPLEFDTPIYWSRAELDELQGTEPYRYAESRYKTLQERHYVLTGLFEDRMPGFLPEGLLSFNNFRWGHSIQWSRLFEVVVKHPETGKAYKSPVLIPLLDLINTGLPEEINTECAMNDESTHVECKAAVDIAAGQELLRQYETYQPTYVTLNNHGVAFGHSLDDVVHIRLKEVAVTSPAEKRALLMRLDERILKRYRADTSDGKEFTVDWRRLPSELSGLMAMMRILHMSPREMAVDLDKLNDALADNRPISRVNERQALKRIAELMAERLAEYPTTIDEDLKIVEEINALEGTPAYDERTRHLNAVLARLAEKRLIATIIKMLREKAVKEFGPVESEGKKTPSSHAQVASDEMIKEGAKEAQQPAQKQQDENKDSGYKVNPKWHIDL